MKILYEILFKKDRQHCFSNYMLLDFHLTQMNAFVPSVHGVNAKEPESDGETVEANGAGHQEH